MAETRDKQYEAKEKWRREKSDQINLKFAKSRHIRELLDKACEDANMSINAYVLQAILEKFERDGVYRRKFDD